MFHAKPRDRPVSNARFGSTADKTICTAKCPLLAQSKHDLVPRQCPLSGEKADMTFCGSPLSRSLLGMKRTSLIAAHMSASDPKRTRCLHCKMSAIGKFRSKHRQTTLRLSLGCFVLQNVPMFGEQSVCHAHDIGCDPILRPSSVREPAVDDHVIAFGNNRARLISQRCWRAPDQIE